MKFVVSWGALVLLRQLERNLLSDFKDRIQDMRLLSDDKIKDWINFILLLQLLCRSFSCFPFLSLPVYTNHYFIRSLWVGILRHKIIFVRLRLLTSAVQAIARSQHKVCFKVCHIMYWIIWFSHRKEITEVK